MLGHLNYIIFLILYLAFLAFMFFLIIKKKIIINSIQRRILFAIIAFCYLLNIAEKSICNEMNPSYINSILPFGNYSPLIFTCSTILIFIPEKWCAWFKYFIGIMWLPMIAASLYNSIGYTWLQGPYSYTCITFDCFAHGLIGLYGFYVLYNKVIVYDKKKLIILLSCIIVVPVIMLILNAIFDTSFFGLNLNGKHNIYNVVLTDNSYISALIYFLGLAALLTISTLVSLKIQRSVSKWKVSMNFQCQCI